MYRYLLLSVFLFAGCAAITPYERPSQQGQLVDASSLTQLEVGMPLADVTDLLGQSTITNTSSNRVDYAIETDAGTQLLSIYHDGAQVTDIKR